VKVNLQVYKDEVTQELHDILAYWMHYMPDEINGGFFGKLDSVNQVHKEAPKGIVLNSRILWSFSAGYNQTKNNKYLIIAKRAYEYITDYFIDKEFGGVYWSVDYSGAMLNGRKQVYGISFCLYGLSEYYKAIKKKEILDHAVNLFHLIEKHAYDTVRKGYYEAFSRDWHLEKDLRLSEKDANEKKTMNTHLHIIEAYANLYEVWPDHFLKKQIENLLEVFVQHIIDNKSGHLILFFDEEWKNKSQIISYGHDIEAAWLLQESAEKVHNTEWVETMKKMAVKITTAAQEGADKDGGLWYEYNAASNHLIKEKHWWPQAEAMIGFLNAYQINNDKVFLQQSFQSWQFIKKYIKDKQYGEWHWGINADNSPMQNQDKAGFWKCPYHNSRACLEIIKRLS
jgi:cellobiose epimerase